MTSFTPSEDELYERKEITHYDLYSCATITDLDEDIGSNIHHEVGKKEDEEEEERARRAKEIEDMKEKIAMKEKAAAEKKLLRKKAKEEENERKRTSQAQALNGQVEGNKKAVHDSNLNQQQGVQQTPGPFQFTMPSFTGLPSTSTTSSSSTINSSKQMTVIPSSTPKKSYLDSRQPSAVQQQLLQTQALKQQREKQKKDHQRKEQESIVKKQRDIKQKEVIKEKEKAEAKNRRLRILENKILRKTALVAKAKVIISW